MTQQDAHGAAPASATGPVPLRSAHVDAHAGPEERLRRCEAELARIQKDQELLSYGIAHDLRAPLRAIDGFAAMLESGYGEVLDGAGREHLARIRSAAARMGSLIDALRALSQASLAPLRIDRVDASLLFDWSLMELGDADPGRPVEARVQPGIQVRADERQLKELVDRVLHNAWKFSAGREVVRIEVDAEAAGDTVRIRVRDHGSGFDPRHAALAFEPFQRMHGPEAGGGHGLGLAIAWRIATRLDGHLAIDTVPGEGTVLHIELPSGDGGDGA